MAQATSHAPATARSPRVCTLVPFIFDALALCTHIQAFFYFYVPRKAQVQGRIEHVVRVCVDIVIIRILLLLILKSRTLTTITQRIEHDVKKSIMQQYSGTPGVKLNFRDYPGKSGRVGRSAWSPLRFFHMH